MTLLSMKVRNKGFLKFIAPAYALFTTDEVQMDILNSVKFIIGRELFNLDATFDEYYKIIFGDIPQDKDNLIPLDKLDKTLDLWNSYTKLPYSSIFLENSSGGFLIQKIKDGIQFLIIDSEGQIQPYVGVLPEVFTREEKYVKMLINKDLLMNAKNKVIDEQGSTLYQVSSFKLKVYGMIILNALTHLNAVNCHITKYIPSRKERSGIISESQKDKYTYHIVDIFSREKKVPINIKEVQEFATKQISDNIRAHMVRGHFKRRTSGVYWWNPFLRCKKNEGFVDKDYNVI